LHRRNKIRFAKIHSMTTSTQTPTIADLLAAARRRLVANSENPAADARVLLSHISGQDAAALAAHPERTLSAAELEYWDAALSRLEDGEALPYVLGQWEFFGLAFTLTPAVLIPRPETELLVQVALDWLRAHPGPRRAADVGAGSGAIAVALAVNVNDLQVTATEISPEAIEVATSNVRRHNVQSQIELIEADLLDGLDDPFDLICANLPYIPTGCLAELDVAKREPVLALDGGPDGLAHIRRLLTQAPKRLAPGGLLLAEVDDTHAHSAPELAASHFPAADIELRPDLACKPRLLVVQT
jgi:release factor glutamine methyltransferase